MKLSISQYKQFNGNKAERAGNKLLGIPKNYGSPEALIVGNMFEDYITKGSYSEERLANEIKKYDSVDLEKVITEYDQTVANSEGLETVKGEYQVFVSCMLHGIEHIGYIDVVQGDKIIDIKTSGKKTSLETKSMFSGLTKGEEYELQLWFYMKATGLRKASIVEVVKFAYKKPGSYWYEYEMNWTDEMDDKWMNWTKERAVEMKSLHDRFKVAN